MREIKFRAWNESNKEFCKDSFAVTNEGKVIVFHTPSSIWETSDFCVTDQLTIIQYTGLKDKNGTEIYEGDILHKDCFWSRFIEFEKGSFVSSPLNKVQYNNRKFYPIGCSDYQDWEVIGNIYENPEMLNVGSVVMRTMPEDYS